MIPRLDDKDPYEPRDPGDAYARRPDPHDYSTPKPSPDPEPSEQEPTPSPRPIATGPSYVSVPCTSCGYNLTGVAIGGNCPECGARVDNSLYAAGNAPANGFAITSMVLGIIAVSGLCCCPTGYLGIVGLVFGIVANNQMSTGAYNNASKGMATAGLVCSGIGLGLAIFWTLMALFG